MIDDDLPRALLYTVESLQCERLSKPQSHSDSVLVAKSLVERRIRPNTNET